MAVKIKLAEYTATFKTDAALFYVLDKKHHKIFND